MRTPKGEGKPLLTLEHVSLRLQSGIVFEDTRWEILQGQQWVVLGPNGSGKSLLVKAVLGKVPVVGGQIVYHFLDKRPHEEAWETFDRLRGLMACVSPDSGKAPPGQGSGFYQLRWNSFLNTESPLVSDTLFRRPPGAASPFPSARDAAGAGLPAETEKEVIGLLGIEGLLERQMSVLSDGEMRRVLIAQALLRGPRLLVLENPFTGLDTAHRASLRRIIGRVMERQTLVILVTARAEEIPDSATHVLRVDRNRVLAQGPKKEVLSRYVSKGRSEPIGQEAPGSVPRGRRKVKEDPPAGARLLELRKVNISYEGTHILKGITWEVRKGEHWALLGPNGAGKTTLLSLILGDNPQAYANHVALFGAKRGSGETIWDVKSRIGWVAPELHLHYPRRFSCLEVACSGFFDSVGLFRRVTPDQRRAAESLLGELGMGDRLERSFGSLSHGEQRMALLGRALVKRPPLLVLDEPCQGLDEEHRRWFVDTVDGFGRRGETTIVYVTHEWDELPSVLTHALLLRKGRVARRGPMEEVMKALTSR